MRTGGAGGACAQGPDRGSRKSFEKKNFPKSRKNLRMRTGGAGGTCAQGPDRGSRKSFEKKKFSEKSKKTCACALVVPGRRACRARTAEDGKVSKKKKFPKSRKKTRACALAVPGVHARRARTTEDGKVSKKKFFSEKSKNTRACALTAPVGRARRARTAEDGKVSKKKFFSEKWKNTRACALAALGGVRAGPGPRKMEKFRKKIFSEMSQNTRACALVAPGGRARRARTAEYGKVSKTRFFRKVEKYSRMRTGGAGGGGVRAGPGPRKMEKYRKKIFFPKSRKILAHAHWWRRGDVRVGLGPRNMEKFRKKKNFRSRKILAHAHWRRRGAGRACRARTAEDAKFGKKNFRRVGKNSRMRLSGTCRKVYKSSTAKLMIVKLKTSSLECLKRDSKTSIANLKFIYCMFLRVLNIWKHRHINVTIREY